MARPIPIRLRRKVAKSFYAPSAAERPRTKRVRRPSNARGGVTEAQLQNAVIAHLRSRGTDGILFWHTPNGGSRNLIEGARLRDAGVLPGIPDLFVLRRSQLYGLELKTEVGRLSESQIACHERLKAAGATIGTAFGLDDALAWLLQYGLLRDHVGASGGTRHETGLR